MMTPTEIMQEKVQLFTRRECVDKLIEELQEALVAAHRYRNDEDKLRELVEELADVEVAGFLTLAQMHSEVPHIFSNKVIHGIKVQLRKAVDERRTAINVGCVGDGDA